MCSTILFALHGSESMSQSGGYIRMLTQTFDSIMVDIDRCRVTEKMYIVTREDLDRKKKEAEIAKEKYHQSALTRDVLLSLYDSTLVSSSKEILDLKFQVREQKVKITNHRWMLFGVVAINLLLTAGYVFIK